MHKRKMIIERVFEYIKSSFNEFLIFSIEFEMCFFITFYYYNDKKQKKWDEMRWDKINNNTNNKRVLNTTNYCTTTKFIITS